MVVNVELLQKTLDTIKAKPQHWDQTKWHCGTSHCFAGFAELIAHKVSIDTDEEVLKDDLRFFSPRFDDWSTSEHATELLGISDDDAETLFASYRTLEDLEEMVASLIKYGRIKVDIDAINPDYDY